MAHPLLSRRALARVLRSLLTAELRAARSRKRYLAGADAEMPAADWPEALPLGREGLGCDSLDLLALAAATNEMFHLHQARTETDLLSSPVFGNWLDVVEAAWRAGVDRITFATSGSMGRPKPCIQSASHLRTEIETLADRWAGRRRLVALAPAHHIYGFLFTAMLPDRLAVPCLDVESFGIADFVAALRPGDLVVSFPERWAYLERSIPAWPRDVEGAVSTAPCPPEVLAGLAERRLARMTQVYGSSETAGIAWRASPDEPYALMPQWRMSEPLNEAAPSLIHADGTTHALMDRITRVGPRSFQLAGRRDGSVQVGGVNVSPAAVAERLTGRPGVRWAAVRLMHAEEGRRLKAFVLPEPGIDADALRREVEAWAAAHLPAAERPGSVTVGDAALETPGKGFDW